MSNALDILKYDLRAEKFISTIRDEEIAISSEWQSKVDRTTLFPMVKEYVELTGDKKVVLCTNVRKQDKDGTWWRMYYTKSAQASLGLNVDEATKQILGNWINPMRANLIFEAYNFHLNGIVPFEHLMFNNEPACVKCCYQWLSEEDRMAAISSMMTPAEYIINKYMRK